MKIVLSERNSLKLFKEFYDIELEQELDRFNYRTVNMNIALKRRKISRLRAFNITTFILRRENSLLPSLIGAWILSRRFLTEPIGGTNENST